MNRIISILILLITAGCSTVKKLDSVPAGFYPDFKGKGFCLDLWVNNTPLPPGTEVVIPENTNLGQLSISNYLPEDVFMRVEINDFIETVVKPPENPEISRRAPLRFYGKNSNPKSNEFLLIRGTKKTHDNYRGPDSYHRWIELPENLKHFKVSGTIKIIYYLLSAPEEHTQIYKFNFTVKREKK